VVFYSILKANDMNSISCLSSLAVVAVHKFPGIFVQQYVAFFITVTVNCKHHRSLVHQIQSFNLPPPFLKVKQITVIYYHNGWPSISNFARSSMATSCRRRSTCWSNVSSLFWVNKAAFLVRLCPDSLVPVSNSIGTPK
jgi:hypothetical protein